MADPRIKTIRIKTGVVKRLAKEKKSYEKEAEQHAQKVQKLKDDGEDEHVVKKWEEVTRESEMMVPDCQKRLVAAFNELKGILEAEKELEEEEIYVTAKQLLEEVEPVVNE